ncbi:SRPBCC family protein [Rhodococcus sp. KBW08]|uniref:SRPBCC family protein n=1 Tax=Rhodococcus sp. KBW08 TaxID=2144188 RepID=UPI0021AA1350|nr:SRPBCC family protein [Rhodococcus sp. KBW08]
MQHTVVVITDIHAPPAVIFDLELDMDEHSASLRKTDEVAVTSTGRPALEEGDEVSFTARHFGWRFSMTSRITQYNRPYSFTDEQVRGPFTAMQHEHVFDIQPGGWTRMHDRFTVTAPFGVLGHLALRLAVGPYLRRLLEQRAAHIKTRAEADTPFVE